MINEELFKGTIERAKVESFDFRAGHPLLASKGFEKITKEELEMLAYQIERKTARKVQIVPHARNTGVIVDVTSGPILGGGGRPIYNGNTQYYWEVHVYGHNLSDVY